MFLTYTNEKGESISLTNKSEVDATPVLLTGAEGLHGLPADVRMLTQHGQDGATHIDTQLPPRQVTLYGKIVRDVVSTRMHMLRVLHPKLKGSLFLTRGEFVRRLECVVGEAPSFARKDGATFTLELTAPNPYWLDAEDAQQEIARWESLFEWPLDIPESGISFGERSTNLITNVVNPGDATVGMEIRFSAVNDVINPVIANVTSQKRMRMRIALADGDLLTISTGYGEKRALLRRAGQATPENAMKYLDIADPLFEFLLLEPGDNLLRYEADLGLTDVNIAIRYTPGYVGV